MPTLSESLAVAGASRNQFNAWLREGVLSTDFRPTTAGVARDLSRENCLELAFLGELTRVNVSLDDASFIAREWLRQEREGRLPAMWAWNPRRGYVKLDRRSAGIPVSPKTPTVALMGSMGLEDEAIGASAAQQEEAPPPPTSSILLVHLAEIVRRVDTVFGQQVAGGG